MSKAFAYIYAFLILFQSFNINLEDFSRFGALLEHAHYHKEMYGDTFFQFLAEHYGDSKDAHESEHEEHKDLPFKDAHHFCSHINIPFINTIITYDFTQQDFIKIPFNFHYTESHTNFEKSSVFQPPKLA